MANKYFNGVECEVSISDNGRVGIDFKVEDFEKLVHPTAPGIKLGIVQDAQQRIMSWPGTVAHPSLYSIFVDVAKLFYYRADGNYEDVKAIVDQLVSPNDLYDHRGCYEFYKCVKESLKKEAAADGKMTAANLFESLAHGFDQLLTVAPIWGITSMRETVSGIRRKMSFALIVSSLSTVFSRLARWCGEENTNIAGDKIELGGGGDINGESPWSTP